MRRTTGRAVGRPSAGVAESAAAHATCVSERAQVALGHRPSDGAPSVAGPFRLMDADSLIKALVVLPMAGFLLTAVVGRRLGKQAHWIPVGAIFAVWVIAMVLVVQVLSGAAPLLPGSEDSHGYVVDWFTWIPADDSRGESTSASSSTR